MPRVAGGGGGAVWAGVSGGAGGGGCGGGGDGWRGEGRRGKGVSRVVEKEGRERGSRGDEERRERLFLCKSFTAPQDFGACIYHQSWRFEGVWMGGELWCDTDIPFMIFEVQEKETLARTSLAVKNEAVGV